MSFYPIVLDWQGVPCLVAGGGAVAARKAKLLSDQGADVTVVAPMVCKEIRDLPVRILERCVTAEDAAGKRLVVDATGSAEAEAMLSALCRREKIPFNSACRVDDGTAVFPAVHQTGRTMLAVSTLGASPAACAYLRDELAARVPEEMDAILCAMGELRPLSREWFSLQADRKRFFRKCLCAMLRKGGPLTDPEIEAVRRETEDTKKEENDR